ncbi:MAG: TIGR03905 family TSCPD domain-containing protein [Muribaculaceae bacterium]|nr:TIGR03905 family TSCPD domain-containing protein [Muribaculaceae bacterium]
MIFEYNTQGTCSRKITIEVSDGIVRNVSFLGGCHGNTQGISALTKGMKITDVIDRCKGIRCGNKGTSCPDQLACALESVL